MDKKKKMKINMGMGSYALRGTKSAAKSDMEGTKDAQSMGLKGSKSTAKEGMKGAKDASKPELRGAELKKSGSLDDSQTKEIDRKIKKNKKYMEILKGM